MFMIRNWSIRYKLLAVVCVPVLAATGFASVRIHDRIGQVEQLSALAEQARALPAVVEYGTTIAIDAGLSMLRLPPVPAEIRLHAYQEVAQLAARPDLDPEVADKLTHLLGQGQQIEQAIDRDEWSPQIKGEHADAFLTSVRHVIRAMLDRIDNTPALIAGSELLQVWDTQRLLLHQVTAFGMLIDDPRTGISAATIPVGLELATLSESSTATTVSPDIEWLRAEAQRRQGLATAFDARPETIEQLRTSLVGSSEHYRSAMTASTKTIADVLDNATATARAASLRDAALVLTLLGAAILLALGVAQSMVGQARRAREQALHIAHHELPTAIAHVKDGTDPTSLPTPSVTEGSTDEIGDLLQAVAIVNHTALRLAGEQARLRTQVAGMLETLARRTTDLIQQQLALIEALEHEERDPNRLSHLFTLDHLATRMKRTGESLLVLAGSPSQTRHDPCPLNDVLRAAVSQVEDYQRVRIGTAPAGVVIGTAVHDVVHLIAELVDNALRASTPDTNVTFAFSVAVDGGILLEIADAGVGIPPHVLPDINTRMTVPDATEIHAPRQMGLFVVARLAARHRIQVTLRPTFDSPHGTGITASVYLPASLLAGLNHAAPVTALHHPRPLPTSGVGRHAHRSPMPR